MSFEASLYAVLPSAALRDAADVRATLDASRRDGAAVDVREAWAGLHFLMTAEPPISKEQALGIGVSWNDDGLENVLLGGEPLPFKTAFGPARRLDVGTVAKLSTRLQALVPETLSESYDPDALEDEAIPPSGWHDDEREAWLTDHYRRLRDFYARAAGQGSAVVVVVS